MSDVLAYTPPAAGSFATTIINTITTASNVAYRVGAALASTNDAPSDAELDAIGAMRANAALARIEAGDVPIAFADLRAELDL